MATLAASPVPPSHALPELELVRAATLAPSPDNNQPWRFRFEQGKLLVYEDRARRLPSDVCSMFSMLALGAAVENVVIEATRHGLAAHVHYLEDGVPGPSNADVTHGTAWEGHPPYCQPSAGAEVPLAEVRFSPSAEPDRLALCLQSRCTNRHPFSRQPVQGAAIDQMTAAVTRFDGCRVTWITQRPAIRHLSKLVAIADRVRFERAEFHAELFRQLRFSAEEAERTCDGLDVRTLGLPPGGGLLLRSLKSWPLVRALNRLGLSRMLTTPSTSLVRKSGALGLLTVDQPISQSFFAAGRAFERLWLTATDLGLSLHPLGSLPIFVGHHELLGGRALDPQPIQNPKSKIQNPTGHARLAAVLSQRFRSLLPEIAGQTPVMLFRIGSSRAMPVHSLRLPAEEVIDAGS